MLSNRKLWIAFLGTAGSWFFFNVAVYGNYVSQPLLIKSITPHGSIVSNIAVVPSLSATVVPFATVFGLSLFGVAFGPNYTTMLLAAESYPTSVRSTFHGLSSGIAKIGAFAGALIVPLLLSGTGLRAVTLMGFCCYAAGIATTMLVREPSGQALDDISRDLTAS